MLVAENTGFSIRKEKPFYGIIAYVAEPKREKVPPRTPSEFREYKPPKQMLEAAKRARTFHEL